MFEVLGSGRYSRLALNGLDYNLEAFLSYRNGFFVELGANDGLAQSNTYYFEALKGWRGLLIEAIPELYHKAVRNRPKAIVVNCACVSFSYSAPTISMTYSNLTSLVNGALKDEEAERQHIRLGNQIQNVESYTLEVQARTLTSVLTDQNVRQIDLLSLDVEGYESEVLRGLDFSRFLPRYILVEARFREDIDAILLSRYQVIAEFEPYDVLYQIRTEFRGATA